MLAAAAVVAVVVNAGAAWAYWRVTDAGVGHATGSAIELNLRGRSDYNRPLSPGSTGNLIVTVTNDNNFPVRVTSVSIGTGNVVADAEHRDAGCLQTGVALSRPLFEVSWDVARNTVGAFTVVDGLARSARSDPVCRGATFTVPVRAQGVVA
jgi:hypothetical protein